MTLDVKEKKFLNRRFKVRRQGFLTNPVFVFFMLISYSIGLFQFYIRTDQEIAHLSIFMVTFYWFWGVALWIMFLRERNIFLKIIDKLSSKDLNDTFEEM